MDQSYVNRLLQKYLDNTCTQAEKEIVESWYNHMAKNDSLPDIKDYDLILAQIYRNLPKAPQKKVYQLWPRLITAASVLLFLGAGLWFFTQRKLDKTVAKQVVDVPAGRSRAILKLANGKQIELEASRKGFIAQQNNVRINKNSGSSVNYQVVQNTNEQKTGEISFNTLETPTGGIYQLVLSDGTKVWLNASSSIKFPVHFLGKERLVTVTGEAYFEVAHNKSMPFKVDVGNQQIEVLGTHFNINSYADEPDVRTTLFEGSVKLISMDNSGKDIKQAILKPGQQAAFKSGHFQVSRADTATAHAWQEGMFLFEDADIQTVMRQVSRWYNVKIQYHGEIPKDLFTGGISRGSDLSALLSILKLSHVRFGLINSDNRKTLIINP